MSWVESTTISILRMAGLVSLLKGADALNPPSGLSQTPHFSVMKAEKNFAKNIFSLFTYNSIGCPYFIFGSSS